jgi:hypothetical protein
MVCRAVARELVSTLTLASALSFELVLRDGFVRWIARVEAPSGTLSASIDGSARNMRITSVSSPALADVSSGGVGTCFHTQGVGSAIVGHVAAAGVRLNALLSIARETSIASA